MGGGMILCSTLMGLLRTRGRGRVVCIQVLSALVEHLSRAGEQPLAGQIAVKN
jgi:hypothetical protein